MANTLLTEEELKEQILRMWEDAVEEVTGSRENAPQMMIKLCEELEKIALKMNGKKSNG